MYHFDKAPVDDFDADPVISTKDAMKAVEHMQKRMLQQRTFSEMKYALMEKKLKDEIAFLKNKMSSNKDLLEALTLEQERQKTLAVELDITKKTAMQNEKANDVLKE